MIRPVTKSALYEEIVVQIQEQIKSGAWPQGQQLPSEMELAASFGVSRNCIREALKSLALGGVVYAKPGQGTFVTADAVRRIENTELLSTISGGASLQDLMETRIVVESQIAGLAAGRANKKDKAKLKKAYELLAAELEERKKEDGIRSNPTDAGLEFHTTIVEISRNKILQHFLQSIRGELHAQRALMKLCDRDIEQMIADHHDIYLAIEKNDAELAIEMMRRHLENSYQTMKPH